MDNGLLKIGNCQIAPVWLNKEKSILKILDYIQQTIFEECETAVLGIDSIIRIALNTKAILEDVKKVFKLRSRIK